MRRRDPSERAFALAAALLLVLGACGFEPGPAPMHFALAPATVEATRDAPHVRERIQTALEKHFGTPAAPVSVVIGKDGADRPVLDVRESAELYRQECLQCHGVEGGGDGPMSHYLVPKPRDFRNGIFKWTALKDQSRPRREDLVHTLDEGIQGTSMPNYQRLSVAEREGLADYVRLLSMRGEVERALLARWREEDELEVGAEDEELESVRERWERAYEKLVVFDGVVPPSTSERIERGRALFRDPMRGNCASCHGDDGKGDGFAAYKLDVKGRRLPAYVDAWGEPIAPRNLRDGMFRGGSRPIDVYRRIYAGIPGGPMPAMGETKNARGELFLSADDIWCLVHYVRHLANEPEGP
jgi:mono/diheme cytochrome c family protein